LVRENVILTPRETVNTKIGRLYQVRRPTTLNTTLPNLSHQRWRE
jgi:hypothetical protein